MNILEKYEKYLYLIFLIGIVIYFPIFFNGFVWDDLTFVINNSQVHQLNLPLLLGSNDFNSGPFYRPLPAVYFSIVYSLFGKVAFFYHLLQLLLHIVGTFLLFIFFCTFFEEYIAFFLCLIFLVHPINVESVAYIGSTQSELYFIPGISALLLAQKKHLSNRRFYSIFFFLLISIFTKEVGFLFLFLTIFYRFIFKLSDIKRFLIFTGLSIIIYILMRVFYGGVTYSVITFVPIASLSLYQRLLNIPAILIYYIKTFIFPTQLMIWQFWAVKMVSLNSFFFPLILDLLIFGFMLVIGFFLLQRQRKGNKHDKQYFTIYLFFFIWFIIGLGMLLQIVPLDMTVADRWFYFPIAGLLGMVGVSFTAWLPTFKTHKKQYILIASILLLLLATRTFIRTFDYKDNYTLLGHDIREGNNNPNMMEVYEQVLWNANKKSEACNIIKRSAAITQDAWNMTEVGNCYQMNQQYDEAITAYKRALQIFSLSPKVYLSLNDTPNTIYYNLAQALILADRPQEAIDLINNQALPKYPGDTVLKQLLNNAESEANEDNSLIQNVAPSTSSFQNQSGIGVPSSFQQTSVPML